MFLVQHTGKVNTYELEAPELAVLDDPDEGAPDDYSEDILRRRNEEQRRQEEERRREERKREEEEDDEEDEEEDQEKDFMEKIPGANTSMRQLTSQTEKDTLRVINSFQ